MGINFEKIHHIFDGLMINICQACGGVCEQNQIAVLLPGEEDFIAAKIGIEKEEFLLNYCTKVQFGEHEIVIIKIGICPFLNNQYRCDLEQFNCKVIQCLLYPVLIESSIVQGKAIVDESFCPMANLVSPEFKSKAWQVLEELKSSLPEWWLSSTRIIDSYIYNYDKFKDLSAKSVISFDELINCRVK